MHTLIDLCQPGYSGDYAQTLKSPEFLLACMSDPLEIVAALTAMLERHRAVLTFLLDDPDCPELLYTIIESYGTASLRLVLYGAIQLPVAIQDRCIVRNCYEEILVLVANPALSYERLFPYFSSPERPIRLAAYKNPGIGRRNLQVLAEQLLAEQDHTALYSMLHNPALARHTVATILDRCDDQAVHKYIARYAKINVKIGLKLLEEQDPYCAIALLINTYCPLALVRHLKDHGGSAGVQQMAEQRYAERQALLHVLNGEA